MRILTEPKNALVTQYVALLATENVRLTFTDEAIDEIARIAAAVNERTENIGARRLHTVLERLLDEISFDAPEMRPPRGQRSTAPTCATSSRASSPTRTSPATSSRPPHGRGAGTTIPSSALASPSASRGESQGAAQPSSRTVRSSHATATRRQLSKAPITQSAEGAS